LPASSLAELSKDKDQSPQLVILSGRSGAGKSSWCRQLAEEAVSIDLMVGGLISPPVFLNGHKVGIDLLDLISGKCRRLAIRRSETGTGIETKEWLLDLNVLAWGNQRLRALPPCDIVILDELGPQELQQDGGLQEGLKLIESRRIPLIVAVVRPKLLPEARSRWPWGRIVALATDPAHIRAT
jgi:nucleoside-triphosphatase THEP1